MALFTRNNDDLSKDQDIAGDVDESQFVPYACHYDAETILTKNGELLQTLKVTGFTYEAIDRMLADLRSTIRTALSRGVTRPDYAIWLHTIRRKTSLMPGGEFPPDFSGMLNDAWRRLECWDDQYTNEVYITVVKEGERAQLLPRGQFLRALVPGTELGARWQRLGQAADELKETCEIMLLELEGYGARRLTCHEREDGAVCSEPLTFLHKLSSLADEPQMLPEEDLSSFLSRHEVNFGFNALQVRDAARPGTRGKKRFGAMLTIKEYHEIPVGALDDFLQIPAEFIISQCLDFINQKQAMKVFKEQQEYYRISGEKALPRRTGLDEIATSGDNVMDFGEHQINIFVQGDTVRDLERNLETVATVLQDSGIIAMREDIKLEEAYWSIQPGNFEFLRRLRPITTRRFGGFAHISNVPAGLSGGSIWGEPVSIFHTAAKTPYFFNFHIGNNGHTSIVGPFGAGKTVLQNFLISQAQKFSPRTIVFDHDCASEICVRAIGGSYHKFGLHPTDSQPRLNPLQLDDTPANRSFLLVWLETLLTGGKSFSEEERNAAWPSLVNALDLLYQMPREERTIAGLAAQLRGHNDRLATALLPWHEGEYAGWFNNPHDTLRMTRVIGFDIAALEADRTLIGPVLAYLIHRAMLALDGTPSVLVLDEAWRLLDNPVLSARLGGWLEALRARNTIAILTTEHVDQAMRSQLSPTIMSHMASQIYLPNPLADHDAYRDVFGIGDLEVRFLQHMDRKQRHFMLRRGGEAIVASLKLDALPEMLSVLSADDAGRQRMRQAIAQFGPSPGAWLPAFFDPAPQRSAA